MKEIKLSDPSIIECQSIGLVDEKDTPLVSLIVAANPLDYEIILTQPELKKLLKSTEL